MAEYVKLGVATLGERNRGLFVLRGVVRVPLRVALAVRDYGPARQTLPQRPVRHPPMMHFPKVGCQCIGVAHAPSSVTSKEVDGERVAD